MSDDSFSQLITLLYESGHNDEWLRRLITGIAKTQARKQKGRRRVRVEDVVAQGYVVAAEVAASYDPSKGPLEHYLASALSRELLSYVQSEQCLGPAPSGRTVRRYIAGSLDPDAQATIHGSMYGAAVVPDHDDSVRENPSLVVPENVVSRDSAMAEDPAEVVLRDAAAVAIRVILAEFAEDHPQQAEVFMLLHADVVRPEEPTPTKAEVAAMLGISEEAVKGRYLRARHNLRERFRGAGMDADSFLS